MRRRAVAPLSLHRLATAALGRQQSLASNAALRELIRSNLGDIDLRDALIPALVVATDSASGDPVVLYSGSAVESLLASCAFPGLYPPVTIRGRATVDGGVSADTPILQTEQFGAVTTYVLPCATRQTGAIPATRTACSRWPSTH